jgi:hypothetical protein
MQFPLSSVPLVDILSDRFKTFKLSWQMPNVKLITLKQFCASRHQMLGARKLLHQSFPVWDTALLILMTLSLSTTLIMSVKLSGYTVVACSRFRRNTENQPRRPI